MKKHIPLIGSAAPRITTAASVTSAVNADVHDIDVIFAAEDSRLGVKGVGEIGIAAAVTDAWILAVAKR